MKNFFDAVISQNGNGRFVAHHLAAYGINGWQDCTKSNLSGFVKHLVDVGISPASAKTYADCLKTTINRYKEDVDIPCKDVTAALKAKSQKAQKIYLNEQELEAFARVKTKNNRELFVQLCFLVSANTGMRLSDTMAVDLANVSGNSITYVSQKTKIEATIPISDATKERIARLQAIRQAEPSKATYESICRRLGERAGICDDVKVFKAGKYRTGKKWEFITSHTARVSFASILADKDVPTRTIMRLMGHTDERTTMGYIVSKKTHINDDALSFLLK